MKIMFEGATGKIATNNNFAEWDEIIDGIIQQAKAEFKAENK